MLDTGSGINSITEKAVVDLMNVYHSHGIRVGDPQCPIDRLEDWENEERVRGIAAGASVRLLGAAVIRVTLKEKGKMTGPIIPVRFKITQSGETDWVSIIFGGSLLDDPALGGIGMTPMQDGHYFRKFNITMERAEAPTGPKTDGCYPTTHEAIPEGETTDALETSIIEHRVGMMSSASDELPDGPSSSASSSKATVSKPLAGAGTTFPWVAPQEIHAESSLITEQSMDKKKLRLTNRPIAKTTETVTMGKSPGSSAGERRKDDQERIGAEPTGD